MTEDRWTTPVSSWHISLALASLASAGIHFAVMPDHFDEAFLFGLFFAVVAWAQTLWAIGVLVAPTRLLLLAGIVGNSGVVVVWAVSRTAGVPLGPEPWTPEAIAAADVVSTILEIAIVAGCALLAFRPPGRVKSRRAWTAGALLAVGLSLAVITTVAVTASGHEHGDGSDHAEAGHSHEAAGADHAEGGHGSGHAMAGGVGELDLSQIAIVEQAMKKYKDIKVARAAGWEQEHQDWPELGAHFANPDWDDATRTTSLHLRDPEYLMYSRFLTGSWKLVAVAYVFDQAEYPEPPIALHGATYHQHIWNCVKNNDELEEEDWGVISEEECEIMGGEWSPGGVWMTHVWLVDNPNGIFAETNPTLNNIFRT